MDRLRDSVHMCAHVLSPAKLLLPAALLALSRFTFRLRFESASRSQLRSAAAAVLCSPSPDRKSVHTLRLIMMTGAFATPVAVVAACQSLASLCLALLCSLCSFVDNRRQRRCRCRHCVFAVLGPAGPTSRQFTASACRACQRVYFFFFYSVLLAIRTFARVCECVLLCVCVCVLCDTL